MKTPYLKASLLLLILLLISFSSFSQDNKLKEAAREIMISAKTCALITINKEGKTNTRAMNPFQPEADFTVWFGTNPHSRKVQQIRQNPTISLYYLASDATGYVVLYGKAELVNEPSKKDTYWKTEWDGFYPDRINGYILIKFTPTWMEVISESRGITGDSLTWKAPSYLFGIINDR